MTLDTLLKKIKLEDKCRDFNWINSKYQEGKLYLGGNKFTATLFDKFRLLIKCTQEIYEDSWDIDLNIRNFNSEEDFSVDIKGIVILFKDIEIKNSNNKSHKIKDLFVKVNLYKDGSNLCINDLHGGRTTISYDEWSSNYFHSHLPGYINRNSNDAPPYWSNFCRGSGHINDFIAEINSEGLTKEKIIPFLIQILGLISWESLEGGPHRTISSIRTRTSSGRILNPSNQVSKGLMDLVIKHHRDNNIVPDIEFKLESGKYTIVDNEKFTKFLTETIEFTDTDKARYFGIEAENGVYYAYGQLPGFPQPPNITRKFIFQGQEIPMVIGNPPNMEELSKKQYVLHPTIRSFIKQEIEYDINIKKIRKSTIDRYSNQNGNATKGIKPNKMALQENT